MRDKNTPNSNKAYICSKKIKQYIPRFNKLRFHNAPDRQTDRPTDGLGDKTCTNTRLRSINDSEMANRNKKLRKKH